MDVEYVIAFSVNDKAGRGIATALIDLTKCNEIVELKNPRVKSLYLCSNLKSIVAGFNEDTIFLDFIEEFKNVKYFIILSRHSSETGMPTLTTHVPGNPWGRNDFGGKPWEIPPANPVLMWYFLKGLHIHQTKNELSKFRVSYEVTHHGPTSITRPITFIEIGSSEREWGLVEAHRAVASVVIEGIKKALYEQTEPCTISVGFGGSHYAPLFTRRAIEYSECYGHMIPNYVIRELDLDKIVFVSTKAIESTPGVKRIVIEKVKSEIKRAIALIAREKGIEIIAY